MVMDTLNYTMVLIVEIGKLMRDKFPKHGNLLPCLYQILNINFIHHERLTNYIK